MSKMVEPHDPPADESLTPDIKEFWTGNVNAERLYGQAVTSGERGDARYFRDLEAQRYRTHYHIKPFIARLQPGCSVLEIGCGVGLDTWQLVQRGLRVTAVDLTEVAVETARRRFREDEVRFEVADACSLPFADATFDYVYSFGVLHHTADTDKSVQEAHRVLKPGGEAFVMLYHRRSLNELVHRLLRVPFEEKDAACPIVRRYTRAEIAELFGAFSGVSVEVEYLFGEGYGAAYRLMPAPLYRFLSRRWGWHLMIQARR